MRQGDLVTAVLPGALGKPRPALVIQSDLFDEHPSVTVLPVAGDLRDAPIVRIGLAPSPGNGLRVPSQVMVDKDQSVPREKVGEPFGRLADTERIAVDRALAVFLGLV